MRYYGSKEEKLIASECADCLQGYLTGKKTDPPRTLTYAYAWGPRGVLGG